MADTSATAPRNLMKTALAVLWMYGGRGVGLLWTLALISRLNVGEYGNYGMAFALMAVIGPPLDNPFTVRAMRESEQRFVAERSGRFLVGVGLIAAGTALFAVNYIAWFGLTVAGCEMAFKAYQSEFARNGHADRVWRLDTIRQVASVALAAAYLFGVDHPTLVTASLFYVSPYVVVVVLAAFAVRGHRPAMPGPPRLIAALIGEMFGTALYLQGDVLLLGFLTNSTVVGYYTICWTVAAAVTAVGQSFGMTYHEQLRIGGGSLSSGPPLRTTLLIGTGSFMLVLVIGVGLLLSPAPSELAVAMLIMAAFCGMRTIISVFQVILYAQRRDLTRLATAVGLVPVKLAAVALLARFGAIGAALASVAADTLLLVVYSLVLYRRPRS
ncbi:hypothetical protein [Mycobacterium sp. NPDC006124]|uniref:lipopolysaccharide biosynthesis protein n=1 Tax=Mycobacterium sp. NPDC006124 TaxID=3156729 RepID=UPI0033AD54EB